MGVKPKQGCPAIHHLFFADDALFFFKGTTENTTRLKETLETYCKASGQTINFSKSSIFFNSVMNEDARSAIMVVQGVRQALKPRHYLGLPTIWGKSRRDALNYLKERISDKIQGWRNRLLNNVGKEVLIKAVITAIPSYAMSVFKFPAT